MNGFFPWSVTLLTFALACWIERIVDAGPGTVEAAGFALLAALTALALFEHWMMVLPLPDAALWSWALPRTTSTPPETTPSRVTARSHETRAEG
jgi:putative photosynthetic complex assembly protein 2